MKIWEITGGHAFPDSIGESADMYKYEQHGMTLLDWFAGQALIMIKDWFGEQWTDDVELKDVAEQAYNIASYMIKEKYSRENNEEN